MTFWKNIRDRRRAKPAKPLTTEETHALLSHRFIVARLVGKACLGIGFIVLIFGVTNSTSGTTRSGLALLLIGIVATIASFVHDFSRRRLRRRSTPP